MKILVFTEGTILMHATDDKKDDYKNYVPIKKAVEKLTAWMENGAEISYLTSRTKFTEIKDVMDLLKKLNFPEGIVHSRRGNETFKQLVEEIKPTVFIEDDCQSIGADEVTTPKLKKDLNIHGIVVPEFGGIDQLPDDLEDLKLYGDKEEASADDEE